MISRNPTTLQLRYLQTLREVGGDSKSTVVVPLPVDLMRTFLTPGAAVDGQAFSGSTNSP